MATGGVTTVSASPFDFAQLFGGCYHKTRVLVTGHTGFKGSWLVQWLRMMGAEVHAFALPAATQPNHASLIGTAARAQHIDLRDAARVRQVIEASEAEIVFHLGAQALVRDGYRAPLETFAVNVMGLAHVLDGVRHTPTVRAVVVVTSDKCYRNAELGTPFTEGDPLGGHDPYSASKGCAELLTASYRDSFLHPRAGVATARAGNVIGGGDWAANRLVPDLVRGAAVGEAVPIRSPQAVRPWQHVLDPLAGYLLLGQTLLDSGATCHGADRWAATAWNFGPAPDGHLTVREVIDEMHRHWPVVCASEAPSVETGGAPVPYEAHTLRLDCRKAREQLGWRPVWNARSAVARTTAWYRRWYASGEVNTLADLNAFVRDAALMAMPWARTALHGTPDTGSGSGAWHNRDRMLKRAAPSVAG